MRVLIAACAGGILIALVLALAGCSEVYPFFCDDDVQCEVDDEQGVCTDYNQCAFDDPSCPAPHLSYDTSAGELADVCVGQEED